jgi:hypothetical protein
VIEFIKKPALGSAFLFLIFDPFFASTAGRGNLKSVNPSVPHADEAGPSKKDPPTGVGGSAGGERNLLQGGAQHILR